MSGPTILRISVLIFLSTLFPLKTFGQHDNDPMIPGSFFEVSGQVRSGNNRTIDNVMVRLESASGALVDQGGTDSTGRFRFARLRPGQYRISAQGPGLNAAPQVIDVNRTNPRVYVMLQLVPEATTFRSRETGPGIIDARVPVPATTALEKARAAVAEKKSDEAITHLQKAISIHSDFYEAHFMLGQIYIEAKDWPKAEVALGRAVKINPKSVMAMISLGEVYRRQKKYQDGQKLLEETLKIDNNSWEASFTLGRIYWELKDIPKAGMYIGRTIQLQPNVPEARLLAGNIFIRVGLPNHALVEYEEYLRLAPNGEFSAQTQVLVDKLKKSLLSK